MDQTKLLTDNQSSGFVDTPVVGTRYAGCNIDPHESHGMAMQFIKPNDRVLDVGCGTGDFARAIEIGRGCKVVGIEPNKERAAVARDSGLEVVTGYLDEFTINSLTHREQRFDIIMFMDVLEHVADPLALLEVAMNYLVEEGKILISVPNVAHWTVRSKLLFGIFDYQETGIMDATHLRWFTQKTICDLVRRAGLRTFHQDVSRGYWLPDYNQKHPWRRVPVSVRRKLINRFCQTFPGAFGCQHSLVVGK